MNYSDIRILRNSIDILIDENERLKKKIKILEAEKAEPHVKTDEIDWSYHPSKTSKPYEFPPQVGDWPPGPQVGDVPCYPYGYPYWCIFPPYWPWPYGSYYPYNNYVTTVSSTGRVEENNSGEEK